MMRVPLRLGSVTGAVLTLAVIGLCTTGCPPLTSGPLLSVSPTAFHFDEDVNTRNLVVSNSGTGTLTWSVGPTADWLTVTSDGQTAMVGTAVVNMTIDRTMLPAGTSSTQFVISSNGGNQTVSISVAVSVPPALEVTPTAIDFGDDQSLGQFSVRNSGGGTLDWSVTIPPDTPWVTNVSPSSGSLGASERATVSVTINRDLAFDEPPAELPVDLAADLTVTAGIFTETVQLTARIAGAAAQIAVDPDSIDFGVQRTSSSFSVENQGDAQLEWAIGDVVYDPDVDPWLTLEPLGAIDPGNPENPLDPNASQTVTATVDRTTLDPGDYTATVPLNQIEDGAVTDTVTVVISLTVSPPELVVVPSVLRFGSFSTDKILSVSNIGQGTIDWQTELIFGPGDPVWFSIDPATGTATNDASAVSVTVDRTVDPGDYVATIRFTGFDDGGTQLEEQPEVRVEMTVLENPILGITGVEDSGTVDSLGREIYSIRLGGEPSVEFAISNEGTGYLNWLIDATEFPGWLTSIAGASSDPLSEGQSITLTVSVDTRGLASGPYSHRAILETNDRDIALDISTQVPERESIFIDPGQLIVGAEDRVSEFHVANDGDLSTLLRFRIVSDQPDWLFFSPATGVSISTVPLSFADVSIAIDRYALRGVGGTGNLIVSAEDESGNPKPEIAAQSLPVSVEVAPLTFETPLARIRPPSLVRYVFQMRNIRDEGFAADPDVLDPPDPDLGIRIFEEDALIEQAETNQFVLDASKLRANLLIVLDYSASMLASAELAFPESATPLQDLFEEAVTELLAVDDPGTEEDDDAYLPASFRFALAEFHDRDLPVRLVQDFTEDRSLVLNALAGINIGDHGATPLLPAFVEGAGLLISEDGPYGPFDEVDLRGLIVLTDGRLTTPPGDIDQLARDFKETYNVVLYAIGWGLNVNDEPLSRIAATSGGHYYPTKTDSSGDPLRTSLVNPDYDPLPQPVAIYPEDIFDFNDAEDESGREPPGKVQLFRQDLAKIMGLNYVTLNEDRGVPVRIDVGFDPYPDDGETRLLPGSMEEQSLDFEGFVGDPRLGQISMRTSGIQGGTATVIMRLDYVPRNIDKFEFTIASPVGFDGPPEVIPSDEGGLLDGWELTDLGGGAYELRPGVDAEYPVLPYGAFGDMVRFQVSPPAGISQFFVILSVNNNIYLDLDDDGVEDDPQPADAKFFLHAGLQIVDPYGAQSPALPLLTTSAQAIDFGVDGDLEVLLIENIGSVFVSSAETMDWSIISIPSFVTADPVNGTLDQTDRDEDIDLTVDRTGAPGTHFGLLYVGYVSQELGMVGAAIVNIQATILDPVLNLNTLNLNFGGATDVLDLIITNPGQSTLTWSIAPVGGGGLPAWLDLSSAAGSTTDAASGIVVTVDRTGLPAGSYSENLSVTSNDVNATVSVTMQVP